MILRLSGTDRSDAKSENNREGLGPKGKKKNKSRNIISLNSESWEKSHNSQIKVIILRRKTQRFWVEFENSVKNKNKKEKKVLIWKSK